MALCEGLKGEQGRRRERRSATSVFFVSTFVREKVWKEDSLDKDNLVVLVNTILVDPVGVKDSQVT